MNLLEVCCGSYYDCLMAQKGGAKRVELNNALYLGGLTPSLATLCLVKQNTNLEVICMVRPRGAGFCYNDIEFETMLYDAKILLDHSADGIAFGCLNDDFTINETQTKIMVDLIKSYNKQAIFHRAFDCVNDPIKSVETLIELKVNRILTSGLKSHAIDGIELLKELNYKFNKNIEFVIASGVNKDNALHLIEYTKINQIHSSCKAWINDNTTSNNDVSYHYHKNKDYDVCDYLLVKDIIQSI